MPAGDRGQMQYFLLSVFFPLDQISELRALGTPSHSLLGEFQKLPKNACAGAQLCRAHRKECFGFLALPFEAQPSSCHTSPLLQQPSVARLNPDASI